MSFVFQTVARPLLLSFAFVATQASGSAAQASGSTAQALTCEIPTVVPQEFDPVWGGETWALFSQEVEGNLRIWTGEDGGRLRSSWDGGATWFFGETPSQFTGNILDIWFFPDGEHGFATARGGSVLETLDGGLHWSIINPSPILAADGTPSTLWGVRGLSDGTIFVSGTWSFQSSTDGGLTWTSINVWDRYPTLAGATKLDFRALVLFRMDLIEQAGKFAGSVGAKWEGAQGQPWQGTPDGKDHGVVLHTNTNLSGSNLGRDWWISLDDGPFDPSSAGPVMVEPTGVRYARGSTSLQSSLGFAVGGRGGNKASRFYITQNSGRSWSFGGDVSQTLYDVSSRPNGEALMVGYSGNYFLRDPVTSLVSVHIMTSNSTYEPTIGLSRGALLGASIFGTSGMLAVGDFGEQRISQDAGQTWVSMSPFYPNSDELELRVYDCAFMESSPLVGCIAGQSDQILYTSDGGCNWSLARDFISGGKLNAIDVNNSRQGVAVGEKGSLYYSPDIMNGATWLVGASSFHGSANARYRDVSFAGPGEVWAVGRLPGGAALVVYSNTGGASWQSMPVPTTVSAGLELNAVAFSTPGEGLVVGSTGTGGNRIPKAFKASFAGGVLTWSEVQVPLSATGKLVGVAIGSGPLASAKAIAIGSDGLVLEWNMGQFVPSVASGMLPFDLTEVDVSPSNGTVLIGGRYDLDMTTSSFKGMFIRFDAVNGWHLTRGFLGKDVVGISLTSDRTGMIAGQTLPSSGDFTVGSLGSSVILRYDSN